MALKDLSTLIFYEEMPPGIGRDSVTQLKMPLLFGLFASQALRERPKRGIKDLFHRRQPIVTATDVEFVAAARLRFEDDGSAVVANLAAKCGFGPSMYACLMQMVTNDGEGYLYPTQTKGKIVPQSKEIWRQFHEDYDGRILTKATPDGPHDEPWLNCGYRVSENSLVDLTSIRDRYTQYRTRMGNDYRPGTLREKAFALCEKSTESYRER